MEIKSYFKSQKDISKIINAIIDDYFDDNIDEATFMKLILSVIKNNKKMILKSNHFASVIEQRCGKRRLALLLEISKREDWGDCFEKLI